MQKDTGQGVDFKCIMLSERSQSEKATYRMILSIRCSRKSRTMKTVKKKSVARSWGKGRMNKWSTEEFQDPDTNLYNTLMMDTCHYIDKFSKIIQSMILRENLNVNNGLWVRMIHQCSLSLFNIHYQGS